MSDENKIRIVLFGEGGVGKSALTIRYFQVSFSKITGTCPNFIISENVYNWI